MRSILVHSGTVFLLLTFTFLLFTSPVHASHSCDENFTPYQYCQDHDIYEAYYDPNQAQPCAHRPIGACLSEERCVQTGPGQAKCLPLSQIPPPPGSNTTANVGAPPAGLPDIENVFSKVVSVSVSLAFVALVFVLIWGGIRYLTSGGDAKAIQAAALTITWAGLGVLFLVFAWLILLLIQSFTGVDVTIFDIKHFCEGTNIPKAVLGCP